MKKSVPNIRSTTGISHDYRLAFGTLSNYLERIRDNDPPRTRHLAKRAFLHRTLPRYEEYFDANVYTDVITDCNRDIVAKINATIDVVNELRKKNITDYDRLHPIEQELLKLMSSPPRPPDVA